MTITITESDHRLMRETTDSSNSLVERAASTGGGDELIAMVQPRKAIRCTKNAKKSCPLSNPQNNEDLWLKRAYNTLFLYQGDRSRKRNSNRLIQLERWRGHGKFLHCSFIVLRLVISFNNSKSSSVSYRFFFTGPALKVLSVGDGKILTQKVKERVCHRKNVKF